MTQRISLTPEERKARMDQAHEELTEAVEALVTGDDWRAFLDFAATLPSYSANNVFWLHAQVHARGWETLGHVAGFRTWQTLGRQVRKGEKGLRVLAPCKYSFTEEETGDRKTIIRGFTTATVFAASQTDGEGAVPTPPRPEVLTGDAPSRAWEMLAELVRREGFSLSVERVEFPSNGDTHFVTNTVRVADRLDPAAALKTLAHELAHVRLHNPFTSASIKDRAICEVEAESVAYLICNDFGLPSGAYSLPYVAAWASGSVELVQSTAERVLTCARGIVADLDTVEVAELVGAVA